ncbi:MAG: SDR family oxidoreductase [Halobacteriales archaeon]|nr:SDR family oxidoreductase [Halobacteriales archaeon]
MSTATPLDGRTAIITGASSGIGEATAMALAADGADVVLAARREDRLNDVAAAIETETDTDAHALVVPTDVTEATQVETLVETTVERLGRLDIVVPNAGVGRETPIEEMSDQEYRAVMDVNVDGAFYTARATIPHLRETNGHLVFVGSVAGQYPRAVYPVYAASKWWTRGFAMSLAGQVGDDGIAVTVVNPTGIPTEFGSEYRTPNNERFTDREWPSKEDVAATIAFAARQEPPTTIGELDVLRRAEFSD